MLEKSKIISIFKSTIKSSYYKSVKTTHIMMFTENGVPCLEMGPQLVGL